MKIFYNLYTLFMVLLILATGCEKNPNGPDYQKEITIFGYLWGNENLNSDRAIMISYTQPLTEKYDIKSSVITNADVTITEKSSGTTFELYESPDKTGYYFNDSLTIKPKDTYTLLVKTDDKTVTATTTVPPALTLITDLDTIKTAYRTNMSQKHPILLDCENPEQIVIVDMYCNESLENAEYIDSFFGQDKPTDNEEYEGGQNGEPRRIIAAARIKEFTADFAPEYNVIYWYSSMIVFYGSYTMQVLAIDDNYHNYLFKEHSEYSGGVNGGLGVLGSVCGQTYNFNILKP